MFDFHEKRKIRNFFYNKTSISVLFLLTIVLAHSVYNLYDVSREVKQKLNIRNTELFELESRAQVLQAKVNQITDGRGIEEELRNRFDVARADEQVVILIKDKKKEGSSTTTSTSTTSSDETSKKSFWDWFHFN